MQVMIPVFPVIKIMLLLERKVSKLALSYVNTSDSSATVPRYASQWRPSTQKFHQILQTLSEGVWLGSKVYEELPELKKIGVG